VSFGDAPRIERPTWRAGRGDWRVHAQTVFSLAVAFVCLAAALLVLTNLEAVRDRWSRVGRITVYLHEEVPDANVATISSALASTVGIRGVRHVTREDARREVVADNDDKVLGALPVEAFPASLEVAFDDATSDSEVAQVALKLRALPEVASVETYQRWTERLSSLLGGGVAASAALAVVVLLAVASVIASTMRLLLHRRRIEVEVLRSVGATEAFVRRPFVVEASAQGAAGAGVALLVLLSLYALVRGRFDQELASLLGVAPTFLPWPASLGLVSLGALLGCITALVSLRRMGASA
jgi:cell division transport system permease protein